MITLSFLAKEVIMEHYSNWIMERRLLAVPRCLIGAVSMADRKDSRASSRPEASLKYLVHPERKTITQRPLLFYKMSLCGLCRGVLGHNYYNYCFFLLFLTLSCRFMFPFPGSDLLFWLQTEIMKFFRLCLRVLINELSSVRPSHDHSIQGTVS